MSLELTFLGTGTSAGIPMIGCRCDVCRSHDTRDHRSRSSVLIRWDDPAGAMDEDGAPLRRTALIDTAPELRMQMLEHDIERMDAVMFTHAHADHIFGLDDLRRFNAVMGQPLDIYAEEMVMQRFREIFTYIFEPHKNINKSYVPQLIPHTIQVASPIDVFGATWTPVRLLHGRLPILGYVIEHQQKRIGYCTDVSSVPPESLPILTDLDILVIDALRYRHHPTHLTVDQALTYVDHLRPKQAYLTHIAHDIRHAELEASLPQHVTLSYDGLTTIAGAGDAPQSPSRTQPGSDVV